MINSIIGKKIGMTQIFENNGQVVPVTVIDTSNLVVTQIKTKEKDGYFALQLGLLRKRFREKPFDLNWIKHKKDYFLSFNEVAVKEDVANKVKIGQKLGLNDADLKENSIVKVTGRSRGLGFQGVVKRWNFGGGGAAHGSKFHRAPGAIGSMRTQGEVIKGKRLPGHHGFRNVTIKGLKVVRLDKDNGCLFVKGAVPGKKESVVVVSMQG
jgi:large subunit ribosomal protein L3